MVDGQRHKRVLYRQRGAVYVRNAEFMLLGRRISLSYWASWPFGACELYSDVLVVRSWPLKIVLHLSDIDVVEFRRHNLFFRMVVPKSHSVLIRHHGEGPNPIYFDAFRPRRIIEMFEQIGIKVVRS